MEVSGTTNNNALELRTEAAPRQRKTVAYGGPAGGFNRTVLAMFNSEDKITQDDNTIHTDVELILNYLGIKVEYHDMARGLPDQETLRKYRGILLLFESQSMKNASVYWKWLKETAEKNRALRIVMINSPGPTEETVTGAILPADEANVALKLLQLRQGGDSTDAPPDIEITYIDPSMAEFERRLEHETASFREIRYAGSEPQKSGLFPGDNKPSSPSFPRNNVLLQLRKKSTGSLGDAVVLTDRGGFVLSKYMLYVDPYTYKKQWRINPFDFFTRALALEGTPRPDWTTVNGARILFAHLDGDGFTSNTYITNGELLREPPICAEVILEKIIKAYPGIPFTASLIVNDLEPGAVNGAKAVEIARKIFAMPNVEPASHSYSHPLTWDAVYSNSAEAARGYKEYIAKYGKNNGIIMSRKIPMYSFNLDKEIAWAANFITDKLSPPGKKCRIILWTGNCLPDARAISYADKNGLLNMNGGDARFDEEYPSYAHLAPLYRQVGGMYQFYAASSNEMIYTDDWNDNYGGYSRVIGTFVNSGSPRRITPVDIYHHFYSGERQAALTALRKVYDWASGAHLFPLYASRYIEIVKGFISTRMEYAGNSTWNISGNGALRTIRFDDTALIPDMELSTGIIGYEKYQGGLYVFLDDSQAHSIVLSGKSPAKPLLRHADADVSAFARDAAGGFSFISNSLGKAHYSWDGMQKDLPYSVKIKYANGVRSATEYSDKDGVLAIEGDGGSMGVSVAPLRRDN